MISPTSPSGRHRASRAAWPTSILLVALLTTALSTSACSRKSGCPVNDQATSKVDRKGGFSKNKNSSNLFPKDMRKQMKQ